PHFTSFAFSPSLLPLSPFFFFSLPPPPTSTLFPYTTLFRSYLMDSPSEFGPVAMRQFTVGARTFRFALHHTGSDADLDSYLKDVDRKSTRLNSCHRTISYAVFCLKKKKKKKKQTKEIKCT